MMNSLSKITLFTLLSGAVFAAQAAAPQAQSISGKGVIKAIDMDNKKITIAHEAIPAVNWPPMTMRFTITPQTQLNNVKDGDSVDFTFVQQGNLSLLQARLNQDLAREQIRQAQDGHLPTLSLSASSGISNTSYSGSKTHNNPQQYQDNDAGQNQIGLNFSLPLYQGGAVTSQVKQAQYNFVGASEQLESAHRSVVQTVRSSFNNVNASISSINAYKQAVVSAQSSLDAMEAGYSVGTRTIVDVLDATTTLYNAKQQLSNARYNYLINELNIKSALGTLNEQDLVALNNTLGKPISTSADSVAPENPQQDATADGYGNTTAAVKPASARTTQSSGSNPFRQ